MSIRSSRSQPAVDAGCGYKANVSGDSVTIYPTISGSDCYKVSIGLGDAIFTFNPSNPPDVIKRVITKDSDGTYTPQVYTTAERSVKCFESVSDVVETFTDADGNTTEVTMKKINNLIFDGFSVGEYVASGFKNIKSGTGRLVDIPNYSFFTGAIPHNIKINCIQLFTFRGGYAFIDSDGYVNIKRDDSNVVTRFDMGSYYENKFICEFTIKKDNKTFICKNSDGFAVEVFSPYTNTNFYEYRERYSDVIRVSGGEILKQAISGVVKKSILIDDGYAIQLGEDDVIDIIPNGLGGTSKIKISDGSNNIIRKVGDYELLKTGDLLYNGSVIASDMFGLGLFSQDKPNGLMLGKSGDISDKVKNAAIDIFRSINLQSSWDDEYNRWYSEQTLPSCSWAGIIGNETTTTTFSNCIVQKTTQNSAKSSSILAIDVNGDYFKLIGSSLEKQVFVDDSNIGFNAIYRENQGSKFIAFKKYSSNSLNLKFMFPYCETSFSDDKYLFRY